jgi:hypothetical protein
VRANCTIPVEKTIPWARRIDCNRVPTGVNGEFIGFKIKELFMVKRAEPPQGTQIFQNGTDVFSLAAAVSANLQGLSTGLVPDVTPLAKQLLSMQIKNTLSTDMQPVFDKKNNCLYVTAQSPFPSHITITYQPWYETIDEVDDPLWDNLIRRVAVGILRENIGLARSKYAIANSPVQNNGEKMVDLGLAEQAEVRAELKASYNNICSLK